MNEGAALYNEAFARGIRPDPPVTVSRWADRRRILSPAESHIHGEWRTDRVPYLREIMDRLGPDDPVQRVVLMKAARMAGSEIWVNAIGCWMEHSPSAILLVTPGNPEARATSKERVAPMIRQCPELRDRVHESVEGRGKQTILVKEFEGGRLIITGANSAAGLAWRSVRRVIASEVDQWPADVGGEGDPLKLAETRATTFGERCKIFVESPPTKKGDSRIERLYLSTDRRRFYIPCPHCGHMEFLTWDGKDWFGSASGMHHRIHMEESHPDTAKMECANCAELTEETKKPWMFERGEWRPTAAAEVQDLRSTGYHISALYSPLGWGMAWRRVARELKQAKEDPPALQVVVNKRFGETWEERSERVDEPQVLLRELGDSKNPGGHRHPYQKVDGEVPTGVGILLAMVDKQASWLQLLVLGFGAGAESWPIDWVRFEGDTSRESVWLELDAYLRRTFPHENGRKLRIEAFSVDARYLPDNVYEFCRAREHRRFVDGFEQRGFAIAGSTLYNKPLVVSVSQKNRHGAKVFSICTDTAKGMVYARLRIERPGPGFMHLPEWADLEYVESLTGEKKISGRWKKVRSRNEALDLNGNAIALLHILGPVVRQNLARRAVEFAKKPGDMPPGPGTPPAPRPTNPLTGVPRGGWMSRVKR